MLLTKTMDFLGTMRSPTVRSLKLMIAAMRLRSVELKIDLGVRCKTPIKSAREWGVYCILGSVGAGSRNDSNLGSSQRTIFRIILSNMI